MTKRASAPLAQWDKRYVWHPFTQATEWNDREPLIIASGRGVYLKDIHGRRYIDGVSSLWVNVFGHAHPALTRAANAQLSKIAHCTFLGLTHEPAIRLARELIKIAPRGLSRVFYSDNGSTAVEVAMKMAYQYWQLKGRPSKTKFVAMKGGYHGDTLGAVALGGVSLFHERFKHLLFPAFHVTPGDLKELKALLTKNHRLIAGLVMEPLIQGASGMLLMPRGYLSEVARLCRRFNVKLIVDEVATGFGRTGKMFAVEYESVSPDFLCVAKSLTGGYFPLAATLTKEEIYKAFLGRYEEFKTFFHGHTYTANPVACAVAIENLKLYRKTKLLSHVQKMSERLRQGLLYLTNHRHVKEVRQLGLMVGIELIKNRQTNEAYSPRERRGLRVCDGALKQGVWLRPLGDVVVVMPPLAIKAREIDYLANVVCQAIEKNTV